MMEISRFNPVLLLFALSAIQVAAALSDTTTTTTPSHVVDSNQHNQQQKVPAPSQHNHRPPMSCFVCSTMDYENTADNLCRYMKVPTRTLQNFHQQPPNLVSVGHHHPTTSMMSYPPPVASSSSSNSQPMGTTTTQLTPTITQLDTAAAAYQTNDSPQVAAGDGEQTASAGSPHNELSSSRDRRHQHQAYNASYPSMGQSYDDSQSVLAGNHNNGTQHSSGSSFAPLHGYYSKPRLGPQANFIRTRACFEDENFCSLVSVTRIEYSNDSKSSTKFWALERNCSKSCNTGCMLIGERVRLRVCSQCCRTPNCNFGNGASTKLTSSGFQFIMLLLLLYTIKISLFGTRTEPTLAISELSIGGWHEYTSQFESFQIQKIDVDDETRTHKINDLTINKLDVKETLKLSDH